MEKLQFKLEGFEGPLDLLLQLISKHKLNIYDIEISVLLEQYMAAIDVMKAENLEISSEFLEMAARLVYIKTVMLLPKHDEGEELKRELEGVLLEYSICKMVSQKLSEMYCGGDFFVRKPTEIETDKTYTRTHDKEELILSLENTFSKAKRRQPPPKESFDGIVATKIVSVLSRTIYVMKNLIKKGAVSFKSLFTGSKNRSERVATFLAVLELVKSGRINISEDETVSLSKETQKRRDKNGA